MQSIQEGLIVKVNAFSKWEDKNQILDLFVHCRLQDKKWQSDATIKKINSVQTVHYCANWASF